MNNNQSETPFFKACTICKTIWQTRDDFLEDSDLVIVGYQPQFDALTNGLFLFNHSCRGTISIEAGVFAYLYDGPIFKNKLTKTEVCPGYCLYESDFRPCPQRCECAFVREILQIVKKRQEAGKRIIPK